MKKYIKHYKRIKDKFYDSEIESYYIFGFLKASVTVSIHVSTQP